jgi:hypothetical protein
MQKVSEVFGAALLTLVEFWANKIIFITYAQTLSTCCLPFYFAIRSWNSTSYQRVSIVLPTSMQW